jgi:hypothetical protein
MEMTAARGKGLYDNRMDSSNGTEKIPAHGTPAHLEFTEGSLPTPSVLLQPERSTCPIGFQSYREGSIPIQRILVC